MVYDSKEANKYLKNGNGRECCWTLRRVGRLGALRFDSCRREVLMKWR